MRDPDKQGAVARAWRWTPPEAESDPADAAHVDTWFVNGPYHPHWSWWMVLAVDLIDRPGLPAPKLQHPGAEYEILILSINPDWTPDVDAKPGQVPYLTPADLVYQFEGVSKDVAKEIVALMVDHIVGGRSPDSDYRPDWERALAQTVQHYQEGKHQPGEVG